MKKIISILLCLALVSGCANTNNKNEATNDTIKIAVFENSGPQQECFRKGIERAYNDVKEEYKNSGYTIECDFYGSTETYGNVADITAELVKDPTLTAIIGSDVVVVCEYQAVAAQKNEKILVVPSWIDDRIMTAENDMMFSVTNSNDDMAAAIKRVADELPVKNWAVCASENIICTSEAQYFRKKDVKNVLDYCDIDDLGIYYDSVKERWESLGIDGIVLLSFDDEGYEYLYKLKEDMPDLYVVADYGMEVPMDCEGYESVLKNLYITSGFYIDKEDKDITAKNDFAAKWEIHGYNTFRMLADTAVKNKTTDPKQIAAILHTDGYKGIGETFEFEKNGLPITKKYSFTKMDTMEECLIDPEREGTEK